MGGQVSFGARALLSGHNRAILGLLLATGPEAQYLNRLNRDSIWDCFNLDLGTREKNGTRVATGPTKGPEFGCSNPSTISSQRFCQTTMKEKVLQQQQDEETEKPVNFPPRKRSIPYGITFLTFLYI